MSHPKIVIQSFEEERVEEYIQKLDKIVDQYSKSQPILVEIDSFGGSTGGLIRLIEAFKTLPNPICTYCRSKAFSAGAVLLSTIASKDMRYASPLAQIMVHELQSFGSEGDVKDVNCSTEYLNYINEEIMGLLAKSMGLESRIDIKNLIRENTDGSDLFLNAEEAKELGLVDNIGYLSISENTTYDIVMEEIKK